MVLVNRIEGHTNIVKNLVNSHFLYTFNNIAKHFWNAPPPLSSDDLARQAGRASTGKILNQLIMECFWFIRSGEEKSFTNLFPHFESHDSLPAFSIHFRAVNSPLIQPCLNT